jgi:NTP pyrophosphatase (non-canonical NTP hydrolase)
MSDAGRQWLAEVAGELRAFADERDWGQFHSPKNLAMALAAEAGELIEQFQWLSEKDSEAPDPERRARIEAELADVFIYLVRLADRLGSDLPSSVAAKIRENREKYPAEKVRGDHRKYDQYRD